MMICPKCGSNKIIEDYETAGIFVVWLQCGDCGYRDSYHPNDMDKSKEEYVTKEFSGSEA